MKESKQNYYKLINQHAFINTNIVQYANKQQLESFRTTFFFGSNKS